MISLLHYWEDSTLVKSKQSTNTGQNLYSPFKLPACQVKIFGRSAVLKRKGGGGEGGIKPDKNNPQNRGFKVHLSNIR